MQVREWKSITLSCTEYRKHVILCYRLAGCGLSNQHYESLSSALQPSNSSLREIDLSNNDLRDSGVKILSAALKSLNCQLNILRFDFHIHSFTNMCNNNCNSA